MPAAALPECGKQHESVQADGHIDCNDRAHNYALPDPVEYADSGPDEASHASADFKSNCNANIFSLPYTTPYATDQPRAITFADIATDTETNNVPDSNACDMLTEWVLHVKVHSEQRLLRWQTLPRRERIFSLYGLCGGLEGEGSCTANSHGEPQTSSTHQTDAATSDESCECRAAVAFAAQCRCWRSPNSAGNCAQGAVARI